MKRVISVILCILNVIFICVFIFIIFKIKSSNIGMGTEDAVFIVSIFTLFIMNCIYLIFYEVFPRGADLVVSSSFISSAAKRRWWVKNWRTLAILIVFILSVIYVGEILRDISGNLRNITRNMPDTSGTYDILHELSAVEGTLSSIESTLSSTESTLSSIESTLSTIYLELP
jgi:hypothetical protein